MGLISGLTLAFVCPLFFLWGIRKLDFYQTGQFHLILLSLGWGIFAFLLAALTNITLESSWTVDSETIEHFIAPVLEEILKGLFLLILIRLPKFTYSVDGALYGFAAGIGFAIFENFEYIRDASTAVADALQRLFSANLVHASSTAVIGIALGIFHLRRTRSRWLVLALGLLLAIGQHMFFNIMIEFVPSLLIAFGMGILGAVFIIIAMQRGKKQAQRWIKQKLGMDDRVTRGEAAVVDRLASTNDLLLPVFERFGAETTRKVEKLLYRQARLAIKRKALDSLQNNDSLRKAIEAELREMRTEMEAAQRGVGAYAMLFVRGLFTDEMASVWEQMQIKIRERSAVTGGQKGGGLWSTLEERLKKPADSERLE
jgi:RsiW-degrading membrane proteinase PrsW (M82 family)